MRPARALCSADRRAVVLSRTALRFDGGHVRSASAIVRRGSARLVVQDDALSLVELTTGTSIELPRGPDGRAVFGEADGTKLLKPDLEAGLTLPDGRSILFGSGSAPARERLFVLGTGGIDEIAVPELYGSLRTALGAHVELNVEGSVLGRRELVLLQRGNGRGGVDAELRVPLGWLLRRLEGPCGPPRVEVRRWTLGELDGARLSFTDGLARRGGFVFLAAAERSPDAIADGEVVGSAIGFARRGGGGWWAPLVGVDGEVLRVKAEGLAVGEEPGEWLVSTDPDDPERPSELLTVRVR